jgi:hypothetical protein
MTESVQNPSNSEQLLCYEITQNYARLQWTEEQTGVANQRFFLKTYLLVIPWYIGICATFWQVCRHACWCIPAKKKKKALVVIKKNIGGLESNYTEVITKFKCFFLNSISKIRDLHMLRKYTQWCDCKQAGYRVRAKREAIHLRRSYHTCWQ